jgi:hypothetical protein
MYFLAKDVEEQKRTIILLSVCGPANFSIVCSLVSLATPAGTYIKVQIDDLIEK